MFSKNPCGQQSVSYLETRVIKMQQHLNFNSFKWYHPQIIAYLEVSQIHHVISPPSTTYGRIYRYMMNLI